MEIGVESAPMWQRPVEALDSEGAKKLHRLQAENVNLWQVASLAAEYISYDRCEGCVIKTLCNNHGLDECWMTTKLRKKLRELGVDDA